jgi:hypothetical protein
VSTELLVGLFGGAGFATIGGSIIAGLFSRRKLGADATEIITRAASGVVQRLEDEVERGHETRLREVAALTAELERVKQEWRDEREDWRRVNQLHVAFDVLAIAKLKEHGVDLGMEPPPLLPPVRANLS